MVNKLGNKPLVGIGLRTPHYSHVIQNKPQIGWFEIHSENFFMQEGNSLHVLDTIRQDYPLSLHGVGLSLGSTDELDKSHVQKIKSLLNRYTPFLVSEHLSWSKIDGIYFPDLLPIPYTEESFSVFARNIDYVQTILGRELLIENPSSYLEYKDSSLLEVDFLSNLCKKTGAKILLDLNNVYVSACNNDWDIKIYLDAIPPELVEEIHLAGHEFRSFEDGSTLRIDTHASQVCTEVWSLFNYSIKRGISAPTLIEWDTNIPDFEILMKEATLAQTYLNSK
ncbi:MAG: DUF692 domain-containing protein [Proteobacteria bacterium]|nr:DUF692 domain-containing protein [Pseudomonadota bacterium]